MSAAAARRYALTSGAMTLAAGAVLLPLAFGRGETVVRWGLVGWALMAVLGVAGGAWTVARHGDRGPGFLIAMGTCILARLALVPVGAFVASTAGSQAVWAYLVGLLAGYVPAQVNEVVWFARSTKNARGWHAGVAAGDSNMKVR